MVELDLYEKTSHISAMPPSSSYGLFRELVLRLRLT